MLEISMPPVQGIEILRPGYASAGNSNGVLLPAGGTTCHL